MSHNTKINAIFVDIKAGDGSVSVHILNFELFLQITKIVTKSTQEGTEIRGQKSARQPCFLCCRCRNLKIFI